MPHKFIRPTVLVIGDASAEKARISDAIRAADCIELSVADETQAIEALKYFVVDMLLLVSSVRTDRLSVSDDLWQKPESRSIPTFVCDRDTTRTVSIQHRGNRECAE